MCYVSALCATAMLALLLHQLGEEVDHFAPTAESLAYAPPLANSPAHSRGPG